MGWRQEDLARRAQVSRGTVSRIEGDQLDVVTFRTLRHVAEALGARLFVDLHWRGAELDRLLDSHHAALQEWLAAFLRHYGWEVRAEVSFNHYGDRGRYDLLAYHPVARTLLVVEIKTSIGDVQDLLGRLDVKVRVSKRVARELGWDPAAILPMLLVAERSATRRHLRKHVTLFARFAVQGRSALTWLRAPVRVAAVPTGLLIFRKMPYAHQGRVISVGRVRKRHTHIRPADGAISTPRVS
jgi:transcriptional regulator with XRE-family HTH domain